MKGVSYSIPDEKQVALIEAIRLTLDCLLVIRKLPTNLMSCFRLRYSLSLFGSALMRRFR